MLRIILKLFLPVLLVGCSTPSFDTSGPVTESRYIPEEDFLRISEYFTGREPETDRLYLRSSSEGRNGYYWILPVTQAMIAQQPVQAFLSVQIPGAPEIQEFTLETERTLKKDQTLWMGVTGPDWPGPKLPPVAWKISIRSTDGKELETRESYLWSVAPERQAEANETP